MPRATARYRSSADHRPMPCSLEGEMFVPYSVPMGVTMAMPPASSAPVVGELWQAAQSAARNTCRPRSNSCFCSALILAKSTVAGGTLPLALPAIYMPPSTTTAAAAMPAAILGELAALGFIHDG